MLNHLEPQQYTWHHTKTQIESRSVIWDASTARQPTSIDLHRLGDVLDSRSQEAVYVDSGEPDHATL